MFRQVSLAAAALLSVSGIAVVLPASSVAATASDSHQHTLRVSSKRAAEVQYKHGGFTEADKILSQSGRPPWHRRFGLHSREPDEGGLHRRRARFLLEGVGSKGVNPRWCNRDSCSS